MFIFLSTSPHFQAKTDVVYVQGHEGCGEIVGIGPEVTDARFEIVRCPIPYTYTQQTKTRHFRRS
jgi:threonine dehydrogenase-like Zn-dependent dehydrogenase